MNYDAAWWKSLREFNMRFRYKNARTEDFQKVLEEVTGKPWEQLFKEWFYGAGYPSLKGIMGAKSKPQETLSLAELEIEPERAGEPGSRTEVYALSDPPARADSRKIDDDGNAAQAILDFLAERRLV